MRILSIIALLFMLTACGGIRSTQVRNLQLGSGVDFAGGKGSKADFYEAMKQKMIGNDDKALQLFLKVIKAEPDQPDPYYQAAVLYKKKSDYTEALYYAGKAAELEPDNDFYQLLYAEILSYFQRYDEAAAIIESLAEKNPQDRGLIAQLARVYEMKGDIKKAIESYDRLEKLIGVDEGIIQAKKALYLRMNDVEGAANEIRKLIRANPGELSYLNMLADLYNANNRSKEAIAVYREILEKDPGNARASYALANYYLSQGDSMHFRRLIEQAFRSPDLDLSTKAQFIYGYMQRYGQSPEGISFALQLSDWMVEADPESGLALANKAQILQMAGRKKEALETYIKALKQEESNFKIWQDALFLALEVEDDTTLLDLSNEALSVFPNQPLPWFMKGMAYLMRKDYDKALNVFDQALIVSSGNPTLEAEIYARIGDIYHEKGQHTQSDSAYEESLQRNPDNPLLLNNYAYYLSLRGERLARAEMMAERANQLQPRNPNFEDTYGWILYKEGKYSKAAEWLERAINHGGMKNGVILEHYGDILYRLGKPEKALEYWRKAADNGGGTDWLEKKIRDGKLYE